MTVNWFRADNVLEFSDDWTVQYDSKQDLLKITLFADNHFVDELYIGKKKFMELAEDGTGGNSMAETLKYAVGDRVTVNESGFAEDSKWHEHSVTGEAVIIKVDSQGIPPYKVAGIFGDTQWYSEEQLDPVIVDPPCQELDRHTVKVISDYFDEVIQVFADDSETILTLAGYFDGLEAVFKD